MGFWYLRIFGCHVYNGTLGVLVTAAPCEGQSLTQPSDTEIKLDKSEETSSQSLEKLRCGGGWSPPPPPPQPPPPSPPHTNTHTVSSG